MKACSALLALTMAMCCLAEHSPFGDLASKQPLADERMMLDSSLRHHLSFVDPSDLSTLIVDDIKKEVALLSASSPAFARLAASYEGGAIESEDALLRTLKRLHFPETRNDAETSAEDEGLSADDEALLMSPSGWLPTRLANGSAYFCRMPRVGDVELQRDRDGDEYTIKKAGKAAAEEDAEAEVAKLVAGQRLPASIREELKKRLSDKCVTKNAGWWSYELCWEKHVRQFHDDKGTLTNHYLGHGPKKHLSYGSKFEDVFYNMDSVRGPYISALFKNGSSCDVTGEPRTTEIRLYCDEGSAKSNAQLGLPEGLVAVNLVETEFEISEQQTCNYLAWWGTKEACLTQMKKVEGPIFGIRCRNVDDL